MIQPNPTIPSQSQQNRQSVSTILVGICSCRKYRSKRDAVRETWLTHPVEGIECRFFIGGCEPLPDEPDTIVVNADDSYDFLPQKVIEFCRYALENFAFEWLFKCDDDTYVALDRLHDLVEMGGELVGNETLAHRGSPSGGAGYLLSRRIVEQIANDKHLPQSGAEDIIIGEAAVRYGAMPVVTERLRWNAIPYPSPDNSLITAHWCKPDRLRAIHAVLIGRPSQMVHAMSSSWNDELVLFDDGFFFRKQSGCNGRWSFQNSRQITLQWFDWDEETLFLDDDRAGRVLRRLPKSDFLDVEDKLIVVWITNGAHGLPHLGPFLEMNSDVPVYIVHGQREEGESRTIAWRNCDRMIRKWWLDSGRNMDFDRVVFLEWDVLFRDRVRELIPLGDFVACDIKTPVI